LGKNARHLAIALLLITAAIAPFAGQETPLRLAFEVAAIKRSAALDSDGTLAMGPGGRFRTVNFDARNLIAFAYRTSQRSLFPSQIIGAPDWMSTERFDITAKISAELVARAATDPFQTPKLVQSLLEDRFRLKIHREVREIPVFVLTLARKDGVLGPNMRRSTVDCQKERAKCSIRSLPGRLTAGSITLATLTAMLSRPVERLIVNRTGLDGAFDVDLEWSPDQTATDKPSIFTAVQEQLGLKLESDRGPVDVVVIDHVERPTED
jgi:uncharacterized protein (TIGR03435 family)